MKTTKYTLASGAITRSYPRILTYAFSGLAIFGLIVDLAFSALWVALWFRWVKL